MKVLFIGGTGNISSAVSQLAVSRDIDLYLLTRGKTKADLKGVQWITGDISQPQSLAAQLEKQHWDAVVNWIAFTPSDIERDIKLFQGKTDQYIFISSASAYQKPLTYPYITESTPLYNPFWEYSRQKIACENRLNQAYQESGFPITIVRPSFTYQTVVPAAIGGWQEYTVIDRIKKGQKIIVHGDGTSLWTITHARDFAKGMVGLLGLEQAIGHAFHITSDEVLTWNQIYSDIARAVDKEPNIVHIATDFICQVNPGLKGTMWGDKSQSMIFDNSKIKKFVPDFQATIPFKQGVRQTIAWFEANKERQIIKQETNQMMDQIINQYEQK